MPKKNTGKDFESQFKESFPEHIWVYRPPDSGGGMNARFTQKSICDLFAYNNQTGRLILFELKSTTGTSISFKSYDFCQDYENQLEEFNEYVLFLNPTEKKSKKQELDNRRKELRTLKKECEKAMIKYSQIQELFNVYTNNEGISCYFAFCFIGKDNMPDVYIVPIAEFVRFWKDTDKKSINKADIEEFINKGESLKIEAEQIGRSKKYKYYIDFLG